MLYAETEIRRIAEVGFETARKRGKRLCSVDKANVLETSRFWREVVTDVAREISRRRAVAHVRRQRGDAARAQAEAVRRDRHRQHVRRHPVRRSVDARPARSACCLRRRSTRTARACTSRSTARAPDIAGQERANPLATILSVGDDVSLHVQHGRVGVSHRGRGAKGAGGRAARPADIDEDGHAARVGHRARWATPSSLRCNMRLTWSSKMFEPDRAPCSRVESHSSGERHEDSRLGRLARDGGLGADAAHAATSAISTSSSRCSSRRRRPAAKGPAIGGKSQPLKDANDIAELARCDVIITCQGGDYTNDDLPEAARGRLEGLLDRRRLGAAHAGRRGHHPRSGQPRRDRAARSTSGVKDLHRRQLHREPDADGAAAASSSRTSSSG